MLADRCRVVLADDNDRMRALVRKTLDRCDDFDVVGEAADGPEALALVESALPELLLLDLAMPRLDGLAVLDELGRRGARVRVVVFSASAAASGEAARARALGAVDVVEKDTTPRELCERLRTARR
jgi:CheY-like chemotaxis protein